MKIKKTCGDCGNSFPKTEEFFFKRIIKQELVKGNVVEYNSFKSDCKKCFALKAKKRRVKKLCEKYNCNVEELPQKRIESISFSRLKYKSLKDVRKSRRHSIRNKIDDGYNFTTIEQYEKDCKKNVRIARRKYDYGLPFDSNIPQKISNRSGIINLTNSYVAATLGHKVDELPKDLIENRKLIIQLKRLTNQTNYGK